MCEEDHEEKWLIDTACSLHMTGKLDCLRNFRLVFGGGHITFGNNENRIIRGYGVLTTGSFSILRVAYVEGLKHNLFGVSQLCKAVHRVEFENI